MYEILKDEYRGNGKTTPIVKLPTNRAIIQRELSRITAFYHKQPVSVPESHLIVRLIEILNVSYKRDEYSTVDATQDRVPLIAKQLGIAHPYNSESTVFLGEFYNQFVTEVIAIDETNEPDFEYIAKHWPSVNPIRIITHPFTDINFHLCNGKYPNTKKGYAVFIIDATMLMLQYRHWVLNEIKHDHNEIRPSRFVGQWLIPNMLRNHTDICFINRAMDMYSGRMVPVMKRIHPVSVVDTTTVVDDMIEEQIKILKGPPLDLENLFTGFPSLLSENWLKHIRPPDIVPNANMKWVLELGSLRYLDFLTTYYTVAAPQQLRKVQQRIQYDLNLPGMKSTFKNHIQTLGGQYLLNMKTNI